VDVSIIIVSFNSLPVLRSCLDSLQNQTYTGGVEVIVVDNASHDGTPEMVATDYPGVKLLAERENWGFSRGVNLGIREAKGKYFLIINPDTVFKENSLTEMVDFMESHEDAGIVGPKLVFHDGNLQYSCRRFYTWKVLALRRTFLGKIFRNSKAVADHLMLEYDHETTQEVNWLLGACMMARRSAVEAVGLMDERFFLYFEDVDWCYRMKQEGWKVYYYPRSVVVHGYARESAQSVLNRSFVVHLASLIRYYDKWNFLLYFLKKYREVAKILLFLLLDVIAFNAAFLCAYYTRAALHMIFTNPIYPIGVYKQFVLFENLLFVFSFFALGLYRIRRETTHVDELFDIGKAIVFASILLMTSTYLSQIRIFSRMVVAFLVPYAVIIDWLLRVSVRKFHKALLANKIDLKRVCIVGQPEQAKDLETRLMHDDVRGVEVVGVVSAESGQQSTAERGRFGGGLGNLSELEMIIDRYRIQEVVFLAGAVSEERLVEFVAMGRRRVLDITVLTDHTRLVVHQAEIADFAGRPVIVYRRDTRYAFDRFTKRTLDILLGIIFSVVSLPLFVVYCLYAYACGKKPFTHEERLGLRGNAFNIPIAGTGATSGPSDLVSLPLFWLVVTGKMSLVGPYPIPAKEAGVINAGARFRFEMRPGVTGYWRKGTSSKLRIDDMLAQDATYIQNWSLIMDLKILFTTMGKIITGASRRLPGKS
jgi:GT2 family glycosyltransferase/lipopolysaccharide/colanic/teichoic acid biosynthesis glycosyltransferase